MKYVTEMTQWARCRAYLVDDAKGREVARVYVAFPADGAGRVVVDLWDWNNPDQAKRHQRGTASGYGYDKVTAALRGMVVDGIQLHDHCGTDDETRTHQQRAKRAKGWEACRKFEAGIKRKHGMRCANYDRETETYESVYYLPGLERLAAMGYRVRQIG